MYEFRPRGFQVIPPVIKNLIIINALVFFAQVIFRQSATINLEDLFALHNIGSGQFRPHQLVTHMFMHLNFQHILFNMFGLWMFGSELEVQWGAKRFLIFYMACGLGAAVLYLATNYYESTRLMNDFYSLSPEAQQQQAQQLYMNLHGIALGASGAVFGCLAGFGYLFPNRIIYFDFLFPVKVKWLVLGYAAMELLAGIGRASDGVAHWAHVGGALVGFLLVRYWNKNNRRDFY